jgi:hypothetical protein
MDHEPTDQCGRVQTCRTRGYPIDAGLRRETQAAHKEHT